MCVGTLATHNNLARRIKDFAMNCHICGAAEDTSTHALLECPLTIETWKSSPFTLELWSCRYTDVMDGFAGPEIAEAEACLFGLRRAITADYSCLIIEGDSLSIILKLHNKIEPGSVENCGKRGGNRVAYKAVHLRPYVSGTRIWVEEVPAFFLELHLRTFVSILMMV
ncbi:hypothetical protein Cgig2_013898 [Carnegiea gigantea]|uniref:Reverse transcriptase n=1 Tax=Carnegiea gigantea TaxID=171969 RepID=A0A9Q1JW94_9CARY|nr:hypothetical protein Cgig2_013898 [Carnegiea gigantea]